MGGDALALLGTAEGPGVSCTHLEETVVPSESLQEATALAPAAPTLRTGLE